MVESATTSSTRGPRAFESDLTLVSVVAGEAWMAEVLAQGRVVARSTRVFDLVGGTGAEAIAVTEAGNLLATAGFRKFVGATGVPARIQLVDLEGQS